MTKDKALKMAIKEMTDAIPNLDIHFDDYFEAINACKEALEQPIKESLITEQEPIAWEDKEDEWSKYIDAYHPVNTKAFADWDVAQRMVSNRHSKHSLVALVCWLLQTNRNDTVTQPAQEPVAWRYKEYLGSDTNGVWRYVTHVTEFNRQGSFEPLYTHPHQWKELSDDEIHNLTYALSRFDTYGVARAIEQTLKDKNT